MDHHRLGVKPMSFYHQRGSFGEANTNQSFPLRPALQNQQGRSPRRRKKRGCVCNKGSRAKSCRAISGSFPPWTSLLSLCPRSAITAVRRHFAAFPLGEADQGGTLWKSPDFPVVPLHHLCSTGRWREIIHGNGCCSLSKWTKINNAVYFWWCSAFIASSIKISLTLDWICHLRYPPWLAVWTVNLYPVAESLSREKTDR